MGLGWEFGHGRIVFATGAIIKSGAPQFGGILIFGPCPVEGSRACATSRPVSLRNRASSTAWARVVVNRSTLADANGRDILASCPMSPGCERSDGLRSNA